MRASLAFGRLIIAAVAPAACGTSSASIGASPTGGVDAGPPALCASSSLVVSGRAPASPHGSYLLSHVTLTNASLSASLPLGGSMQLDWTGDATARAVAITGQLGIPTEDASAPTVWCVDIPSTLQIVGNQGKLVLTVGLQGTGLCSATGQQQPSVTVVSACIDVTM